MAAVITTTQVRPLGSCKMDIPVSIQSILHLLMVALYLMPSTCLDYQIPILPISLNLSTSTNYYINDIDYEYEDDIVRIRLDESQINEGQASNLYSYEVMELEDDTQPRSDQGNGMCAVVKTIDNSLSSGKYLLNYHINDNGRNRTDPSQKFISTVHTAESVTYSQAGDKNEIGEARVKSQEELKVTVYSLTSQNHIHRVSITQSRLSIEQEQQEYSSQSRDTKKQVYKYKAGADSQCQRMELHGLDERLIVVCFTQQSLKASPLLIREDGLWELQTNNSVSVSLNAKQFREARKSGSNGEGDRLYLLTNCSIHGVSWHSDQLAVEELGIPIVDKFSAFVPVHLSHSSSRVPYLLVCDSNSLIIFNLQSKQLQHKETLKELDTNFIQHISYAPSEVHISPTIKGVIELVVLVQNRKQFVIELFHEYSQQEAQAPQHQLHLNKIFHNYHVNSQQPYGFGSDLPQNINMISKIVQPLNPTSFSNSIGILQSKHKAVFFQYGVPRTISPVVSSASEFIKEQTYSSIVDISSIAVNRQHVDKSYSSEWISGQLQKMRNGSNPSRNTQREGLARYLITLDDYIIIEQADPRHLYYYDYACNLNWRGGSLDQNHTLNSVNIRMESLCEQSGVQEGTKLVYCEKEQRINFQIKKGTIQQQRDQVRHVMFIGLGLVIAIALGGVGVCVWKKIRKESEKIQSLRRERRTRLMEQSKLENDIVAKQSTKN